MADFQSSLSKEQIEQALTTATSLDAAASAIKKSDTLTDVSGSQYVPRYIHLPDPATMAGREALFVGLSPRKVYSNGVAWFDLSDGSEVSPWWLPNGAEIHVDFVNSRFYWGGAIRSVGDFSANPSAGAYRLNQTLDLTNAVIMWETNQPDTADSPVGHMWSILGAPGYPTGARIEDNTRNNHGRGCQPRVYNNRITTTANFWTMPAKSSEQALNIPFLVAGINRHAYNMQQGEALTAWTNISEKFVNPDPGNIWEGITSAAFGFNCRVWAAGDADSIAGDTTRLRSWTLFLGTLSDDDIGRYGLNGGRSGLHMLGDSFLNNNILLGGISLAAISDSNVVYIPNSQDGAGGTTLTQQAARYAANGTRFYDAPLVIADFGLEATKEQFIAAFEDLLPRLKHSRFLYLEPAPNQADGTAGRIDHDERVAFFKRYLGDRFVPTLDRALALSDGSPEDLAKVADRLWPVSLTISASDFHPNAAGYSFLSNLVYEELRDRGWITS